MSSDMIPGRKGDFSLTPGCQVDMGFTTSNNMVIHVRMPHSDEVLVIYPQTIRSCKEGEYLPISGDYDTPASPG